MRKSVQLELEAQVLQMSRRRCCICFGLHNAFGVKKGQIAHLDQVPSNNSIDNLAFLCLEHHDEYDSRSRQSKGLKRKEVIHYRDSLYAAVGQFLSDARSDRVGGVQQQESLLASAGELDYYLVSFDSSQTTGVLALQRIGAGSRTVIRRLTAANLAAMEEVNAGRASVGGYRRYDNQLAEALNAFAHDLRRDIDEVAMAGVKLFDALSRAASVASDIETADASLFQHKIAALAEFRELLVTVREGARETAESVRGVMRGSAKLNRGRRLSFSALEDFARMVEELLPQIEPHQQHLRAVIALL